MPDEPTEHRPRRRPVLLAMLVAAALLLALAGSGLVTGSGGSARSSDEGTGLTRDAPAATGDPTHRGRHCHHGGGQGQGQGQGQQAPDTGSPPV